MQTFGYIRFSYMGKSDTRLSAEHEHNQDSYFNTLYAPNRMARRFHLFERITLPSLRAQSDPGFTVFVLASQAMPEVYKARLETAVRGIPQIRVAYSSKPTVLHATRHIVRRAVEQSSGPTIQFRLDDDDALGTDAIAALKAMGQRAEPSTILSLPLGNMLFQHAGESQVLPWHSAYIGAGWARVNGPGDIRSPFKFAHFSASYRFPTMTDPRVIGYAYTLHPDSDTVEQQDTRIATLLQQSRERRAGNRLPRHRARIDAAFPGLGYDGLCAALDTLPEAAPVPLAKSA